MKKGNEGKEKIKKMVGYYIKLLIYNQFIKKTMLVYLSI